MFSQLYKPNLIKKFCCQKIKCAITNNLCSKSTQDIRQTVQKFKTVPRQQLAKYNFNKCKVRYEAGFMQTENYQLSQQTFNKFQNNKPLSVSDAVTFNSKMIFKDVGVVHKKVLRSQYQQLCSKFQNRNELYFDLDFQPCQQSLGNAYVRKNVQWKRISEIIQNPQFISDNISPEDILQGALGDCYFLSALAALAQHDFRIKNIFPNLQMNKNGLYMARVRHRGVLQQVVVDDYIPVNQKGRPIFAKPSGAKQIWVMILEKCWAKLFGSYEAIVGGLPNEVLHAFSGAPTFYHSITKNQRQQQDLFETVYQAYAQGSIMCCGTKSDPNIQKRGLVLGHAYTILDVYKQPYNMVKLRNPWGQKQWNGRASQSDMQFWNQMNPIDKDKLGQKFENDGIFFMLWQDFVRYFAMIDICQINDNANYFYYEDCYQTDTPKLFELQTTSGDVVITFSQQNLRELDWKEKKKGYGTVTIIVSRVIENQQKIDYEYVQSMSAHSFSDTSMVLKDLPGGKYLIYFSVLWTRSDNDLATISVYTEAKIRLENSKISTTQFLQKTFLNHAKNNAQYIKGLKQDPQLSICSDLLVDKCRFGYMVVHLDKNLAKKIELEINQKDYTNLKLELLEPYKNKGVFKISMQPGTQFILLFRLIPGSYISIFSLPTPKINVLR